MNASVVAAACTLLGGGARTWPRGQVLCETLSPDGSSRRFFRLTCGERSCIAVLPSAEPAAMAEANAAAAIGRHLASAGAAVPEVLGFIPDTGLLLFEDLGMVRLQDRVLATGWTPEVIQLYDRALAGLAWMQVNGARGFDPAWCWDGPRYDRQLMLERESGYFCRALCRDLLSLEVPEQVQREFRALADRIAAMPADFFLHRDCQSRNIMVSGADIRFIDFQGGRLGPLAYDPASLLIDPYVAMPPDLQTHLLGVYIEHLDRLQAIDRERFLVDYSLMALQRNLQILGAFAFLGYQRRKPFFTRFIEPAFASLLALLAKPECAGYAALLQLVRQCHSVFSEKHDR